MIRREGERMMVSGALTLASVAADLAQGKAAIGDGASTDRRWIALERGVGDDEDPDAMKLCRVGGGDGHGVLLFGGRSLRWAALTGRSAQPATIATFWDRFCWDVSASVPEHFWELVSADRAIAAQPNSLVLT